MQETSITAAEKGTITHLVMQHIDLNKTVTKAGIQELINDLIHRELLTEEQSVSVDQDVVAAFFQLPIGQRLQKAKTVRREVPFTMAMSAADAYADWQNGDDEILVQGVIDCIFEDEDGLVLLDYKTDRITGRFVHGFEGAKEILAERYQVQLQLYTRAIETIMKKKVKHRYLFFFDGGHLLEIE